ncbi:MAG: XTP/dITP diphosphatase, partial [Thermodesulfovibrionales bacterium]
ATRNRKKLEEMQRLLEGIPVRLYTLDDFPECPEVEENETTFEGNAIKKAIAVSRCTGKIAVSDDSGLEVYALGGAPGVYSARYAGEKADDRANIEKLLSEMKDIKDRRARFVCVIALANPDDKVEVFEGHVEGTIGYEPLGERGFGYDPVFFPKGFNKTFAEMESIEKDKLSHRGKALERLRDYILNWFYKKN